VHRLESSACARLLGHSREPGVAPGRAAGLVAYTRCPLAAAALGRKSKSPTVAPASFTIESKIMAVQLLTGTLATVVNIVIHALFTVGVVGIARSAGLRRTSWPRMHLMAVMVATATLLIIAHTVEAVVWALVYWTISAAPPGSDLLYFSFVNYTTLGYGDILPVPAWRLTGPITAMNGILMFGWSTAVLFEVLRRAIEHLASTGAPGFSSKR
jgi:hypothetical protein